MTSRPGEGLDLVTAGAGWARPNGARPGAEGAAPLRSRGPELAEYVENLSEALAELHLGELERRGRHLQPEVF